MRELTKKEADQLYSNGGCIFCLSTQFLVGPAGGSMQNIKCQRCGAEYNVAEPGLGLNIGQLLSGPTEPRYQLNKLVTSKPGWRSKLLFWRK